MSKILGTIRRGKVKVTSQKQMAFLEVHHIDHTHFKRGAGGKVRKVRHTW